MKLDVESWTPSSSSSSCLVHGAPRRVVRWANQIHESPPFITVLREGFNWGWIENELVKIASDHVNPAGAWGSSGSLPAERARVKVQDSPRRMVRWHAKHMSVPTDPSAGSQRGGCPARARTVSFETRSRQWMPRIDLRALLSKPSSLEERVPVRGQVSAPYSSTDRTAALYMRILVVRKMDCWHHNGLRSACITFDDSARLRSWTPVYSKHCGKVWSPIFTIRKKDVFQEDEFFRVLFRSSEKQNSLRERNSPLVEFLLNEMWISELA